MSKGSVRGLRRRIAVMILVAAVALLVSGFASAEGRQMCIEKNGRPWICIPGIQPIPPACRVLSCQPG